MFGKLGDRLRVIKAEAQRIVFDRQPQAVSHEIDVALNGLGRDLELPGQSFGNSGKCRSFKRAWICIIRSSGGRE